MKMVSVDPGDRSIVPVDRAELAEMLFKARVAGKGERTLAKTYGLPLKEVQALIDLHCPRIDMGRRGRTRGVIEEQLSSLVEYYLPLGLKGDLQAAHFALKVLQQQCIIAALEYAPAREITLHHEIQQAPRPSSTERVLALIERIAGEGKAASPEEQDGPVIEGQVAPNPEQPTDPSVH